MLGKKVECSDSDRRPIPLPHPHLPQPFQSHIDSALGLLRIFILCLGSVVTLLVLCTSHGAYMCICAVFLDRGLIVHLISKTCPWPRKNEARDTESLITPCVLREGREQSYSKCPDSDFCLSVPEQQVLSQLPTGWVWAQGSEGCEKSPSKGKICVEYERQGQERETEECTILPVAKYSITNKLELIWMNIYITKTRDSKKKCITCPFILCKPTPAIPSQRRKRQTRTA